MYKQSYIGALTVGDDGEAGRHPLCRQQIWGHIFVHDYPGTPRLIPSVEIIINMSIIRG